MVTRCHGGGGGQTAALWTRLGGAPSVPRGCTTAGWVMACLGPRGGGWPMRKCDVSSKNSAPGNPRTCTEAKAVHCLLDGTPPSPPLGAASSVAPKPGNFSPGRPHGPHRLAQAPGLPCHPTRGPGQLRENPNEPSRAENIYEKGAQGAVSNAPFVSRGSTRLATHATSPPAMFYHNPGV